MATKAVRDNEFHINKLEGDKGRQEMPKLESFADNAEFVVKAGAQNAFETINQVSKALGTRPYKGLPVDKAELTTRWIQVRRDVPALVDAIRKDILIKPDGSIKIRKKLLQSIIEAEKTLREGGL